MGLEPVPRYNVLSAITEILLQYASKHWYRLGSQSCLAYNMKCTLTSISTPLPQSTQVNLCTSKDVTELVSGFPLRRSK